MNRNNIPKAGRYSWTFFHEEPEKSGQITRKRWEYDYHKLTVLVVRQYTLILAKIHQFISICYSYNGYKHQIPTYEYILICTEINVPLKYIERDNSGQAY